MRKHIFKATRSENRKVCTLITFILLTSLKQLSFGQPLVNPSEIRSDSSFKPSVTLLSTGTVLKKTYTILGKRIMDSIPAIVDTIPAGGNITTKSAPFGFADFSWMNGQSRKTSDPAFASKYFTGDITFDFNYCDAFNHPIDNTSVGSTALARDNELQLSSLMAGGDLHYGNVRGRIMMQFGTRSTIVPRNDGSSYKGQYDLQTIYRYISEAYAGYHWDVWHGINLDAGIFMSYIGLYSYNNFENWSYQPSYTSDNTPWFFNGIRLQTFPSEKVKVELWLVNGWQSYAMFNKQPGFGASIYYRPNEATAWVFNNYEGKDDVGTAQRMRLHLDYSFLKRYYNNPSASFIKKAAFSLTTDFGFESGDGVTPFGKTVNGVVEPAQNFMSFMAYNRVWFNSKWAWTIGGGAMHNPGQYLVLAPTGYADTLFQNQSGPGSKFDAWDFSTAIQYMPSQNTTIDIEFVDRQLIDISPATGAAQLPGTGPGGQLSGYFAGKGGVTSPSGFEYGPGWSYGSSGAANPPAYSTISNGALNGTGNSWAPDMVKHDLKIIVAFLVRF